MEVEVKLCVSPGVEGGPAAFFQRLEKVERLAGLPLGPVRHLALRDLYYDTSTRALARSRCGLRLRLEDGEALLTLKRTRREEGGLTVREEYELPATAANLERVLAPVRAIIGTEPVPPEDLLAGRPAGPLLPVLDVVTYRAQRSIADLGRLVLDRVAYPGLVEDTFYDIEVEAAQAEPAPAVEAALRRVEADLRLLGGEHLVPSAQSKLERGLWLAGIV